MQNNKPLITLLAFFSVYLFWGGTYLGMKFALESFPPFLLAGIRHFSAGLILLTYALLRNERKPSLKEIGHGAMVGLLMLVLGNGLVVYAEQSVPSSIASLMITTVPFWIMLINWRMGEKHKPTRTEVLTLLLAFFGIILLVFQGNHLQVEKLDSFGLMILVVAALAWSIGSLYSRYKPVPQSSYYSIATQTLSAGLILFVLSFILNENQRFNISEITQQAFFAMIYLIVFGSVIAFSSYIWLMKNVSPTLASSNAFVNPVVALGLGYLFANEVLSLQSMIAALIIIGAVTLLTLSRTKISMKEKP